ncbi:MAG TPA: T9SS type A sorting domain-containing protein, partial [Flavisolibacter sp.]|nr:T9SS type A sorting domain-containing protein [Flavisolibacter sp.]
REINNRGFDIERSYDGQQFIKVGFVQGTGSGSNYSLSSYSFKDNELVQNLNYYRLKQIDLNGKSIYSPIILLKSDLPDKTRMKVLGNPFTDYLDIELPKMESGNLMISLTNTSGIVAYKGSYNTSLNRIRIHTEKDNLIKGLYILQVTDGNKKYLAKVYKN